MIKLKHLIAHVIMNGMYDREPELHPQDAYNLANSIIKNDTSVENLLHYINTNYFSYRSFIAGVFVGATFVLLILHILL